MFKEEISKIKKKLANENFRYYFQFELISLFLAIISFVMGVINIFTGKTLLMIATLSFSTISTMNYLITKYFRRVNKLSCAIFEISVTVLFVYFLITGGTAGFSPHWILMLPACGMIFFGRRRGAAFTTFILAIVIFLLWTPLGKSCLKYDYTPEFCMRFPIAYISFFAFGYCSELIRKITYDELVESKNQLKIISETDVLTCINNRFYFNDIVEKLYQDKVLENDLSVLLVDIDFFKNVNDTYGYFYGDVVLKDVSKKIGEIFSNALVCRWGGEEFAVLEKNSDIEKLAAEAGELRKKIEDASISELKIKVTVSIGGVIIRSGTKFDYSDVLKKVDEELYKSKNEGRNCVNISEYK